MQEELFNHEELQQITEEARNPIYSEPNVIHLGSKKLSIIGVAKTNGLTLVYGNEWTGYKHIIERHSLASRKPYWNETNKIDNPSKFRLNLAPIDYLNVASEIFKPTNINQGKNNNPNVFDVYIGLYTHKDGMQVEYKLITYKNSKIIHTFFVNDNKKPFNKKKILNLRQGWVNSSHNYKNCIQTFDFSYYDYADIPHFKVIMRYCEIEQNEKWYIQVNSANGSPLLTTFVNEFKRENKIATAFRMIQIDFENITWIEKIIKQIINGQYKF